ncbi:hypothetical protein B566_EDAN013552 [Ephemera danica]|nr:hypothetical protein B566_EDAN013552 [Ephemera danica]
MKAIVDVFLLVDNHRQEAPGAAVKSRNGFPSFPPSLALTVLAPSAAACLHPCHTNLVAMYSYGEDKGNESSYNGCWVKRINCTVYYIKALVWCFVQPQHQQHHALEDTTGVPRDVKTDILSSGATSFLYIANANTHDSGNYSCALADVADATISVHVLNGESPAAMQHSGCRLGLSGVGPWPLWPLGLLTAIVLQRWSYDTTSTSTAANIATVFVVLRASTGGER